MANKRLAKKKAKQEAANKLAKEVEVKVEAPVVEEVAVAEPEVEEAPVAEEIALVEEVKEEVEATPVPAVEEPVAEEVKEEVAPEKKPAVKRTRKSVVKVSVVVQAAGKEVTEAEVYERVTEDWCKAGNDKAALKTMDVYVKPEESAIYYVINGDVTGRVDF